MASYYIIENNKIINFILADTKEIAESVTGLTAIISTDASVEGAIIGAEFDEATGIYKNPIIETE